MKKVFFSLAIISSTIAFSQIQNVISENFNGLTTGNLGTDVTGATAGQNGWYTGNGTVADYQITTVDAAHGKSLRMISGAGAPPATGSNANNRFAWKDITATPTFTNNAIKVEFEFYTGAAAGAGRSQSALFDATNGIVGIAYDYATQTFKGLLRLTPTSGTTAGTAAFYTANLGTQTFAPNTWVKVYYYYNGTDGSYGFGYPGGAYSFGLTQVGTTYTLSPSLVPTEHDFYNVTLDTNTVANSNSYDNLLVTYSTLAQALSTQDVKAATIAFNVYPNPTSDILNIETSDKIKAISIFDMAGRKMDVSVKENSVDVRNLETGSYLINIETAKGTSTEKFIKK
ncbi:T9SS type A sorting domain-containing protein [Frigoriflavimonas asaccharolytica]|uniref:Secretion system C-terminal sorting domain-containing protein n=1 Tax=Frigoriflavimonas asaccharolytica TaxID=2735899 RepID=A0A8J8G634_9FLAO|nr:T9SS type A sorting domain-containing protein [Frigoriflavimonas asaccharolytica]NRS91929.1 hypothetical protein [Frigoriflavimonas asaccharolytica]